MFMHEDLFERNGGSWNNVPSSLDWGILHKEIRDLFVARFRDEKLWGFKDPRTSFTLSGWLEVLPSAELVGIFRHPVLVARSLNKRDNLSIENGLRLWQVYNQRLLEIHTERPFPLMEFDDDPAEVQQKLKRVIALLDLPRGYQEPKFFDDHLRSKIGSETSVPVEIFQLYMKLRECEAMTVEKRL